MDFLFDECIWWPWEEEGEEEDFFFLSEEEDDMEECFVLLNWGLRLEVLWWVSLDFGVGSLRFSAVVFVINRITNR